MIGRGIFYCTLVAIAVTRNVPTTNSSKISSVQSPGRIIGGFYLDIRSAPYQVSVRSWEYHFCGGSAIGLHFVLTAGHCVYTVMVESLTIKAGATDIRGEGQVIQVVNATIHPEYLDLYYDYDFAILKLESSFDMYNYEISLIPVATTFLSVGTEVLVSGWGSVETEDYESYPVLQGVWVRIIEHDMCVSLYSRFKPVTERMFCAGILSGGRDSCVGDSGGPLIFDYILHGVVSWGLGCGMANSPGVYGSVSYVSKWIFDIVGDEAVKREDVL